MQVLNRKSYGWKRVDQLSAKNRQQLKEWNNGKTVYESMQALVEKAGRDRVFVLLERDSEGRLTLLSSTTRPTRSLTEDLLWSEGLEREGAAAYAKAIAA